MSAAVQDQGRRDQNKTDLLRDISVKVIAEKFHGWPNEKVRPGRPIAALVGLL
jgi:hypothetical protein